jgi:hypothetical protein
MASAENILNRANKALIAFGGKPAAGNENFLPGLKRV